MAIIVKPKDQEQAIKILNDSNENAFSIGVVSNRISDEPQTKVN